MVWYGMVTALEKKRERQRRRRRTLSRAFWCCLHYSYMYVVLCCGFYYLEQSGLGGGAVHTALRCAGALLCMDGLHFAEGRGALPLGERGRGVRGEGWLISGAGRVRGGVRVPGIKYVGRVLVRRKKYLLHRLFFYLLYEYSIDCGGSFDESLSSVRMLAFLTSQFFFLGHANE